MIDAELGELTDIPLESTYTEKLPSIKEEPEKIPYSSVAFSVAEKARKRLVSETMYCIVSVFTLVVVLGLVVVCYFFCVPCLFVIIAISACLCPFLSFFNIPLWVSILLLVFACWHFTAHILGVTTQFNYT